MPETFKNIKKISSVKINYYIEYHEKLEIDGHFGLLSGWKKQVEHQKRVDDVLVLLSAFMENGCNQNSHDPAFGHVLN